MAMTDPTTTPLIDPAASQSPQIKQPVAGPTGTPLPVAGPQTQPAPIATPGGSQVPPNSSTALPVAPAQTYDPTSPYAQQTGVPANLPGGGAPGSPGAAPATTSTGQPWNTITGADGNVSAQNAAASNDWFATHNSDGTPRQPWQGGPSRDLSASDPGTDTLARALGITPGVALGLDADGKQIQPNQLATDPGTGLPIASAVAKYNTPDQLAGVTGTASSSNPNLVAGTPGTTQALIDALPVAGAPAQNAGTLPAGTGGGGQPAPQSAIERALAGGASGGTSGNSSLPVAGPSSSSSGPGSLSLTDQDLTGSTLGVGPTADRMKIIQDQLKNFDAEQDPVRAAQQRQLTQQAAGLGRVGSGALRTDIGNLDLAGENSRNQKISDLISGATDATINDRYRDVGIAQQQQGRQDSQQGVAFNQAAQQAALQEALTSGDFNRYMQLLQAGNQGNPSDTALSLANSYNQEAGQAGNAAGQLISNSVGNQNNGSIPPYIQQILQQYLGNGGSATPKAAANGPLPMTE